MTGTNRFDSTNVLSPRSVQLLSCTHAVQLKIQKSETVEVLCLLLATKTRNQNDSQSACRHKSPTFRLSLLVPQLLFQLSLSFGLVSFLSNAFLAHTAVRSQLSRLVALVRLPTFNTSHHQASSENELFSLELRLSSENENKHPWTSDTDRPQLSHMTRELVCTTRRLAALNETMAHST